MKIIQFLKHPGNLILIGFGLFAAWMLYFSIKAMNIKFEMAVEGDYYQLEKEYDQVLESKRMANGLGYDFNFKHDGNKLTLNIPKEVSANINTGSIEFFCIPDSKKDRRKILAKSDDGVYVFNREEVAPGNNYIVKVSFNSHGKDYYKEFKLM
ncbi:MAG: FixH family protein [Weeksellaceae bacterium]